jgi:hypothetical protein
MPAAARQPAIPRSVLFVHLASYDATRTATSIRTSPSVLMPAFPGGLIPKWVCFTVASPAQRPFLSLTFTVTGTRLPAKCQIPVQTPSPLADRFRSFGLEHNLLIVLTIKLESRNYPIASSGFGLTTICTTAPLFKETASPRVSTRMLAIRIFCFGSSPL